MRSMLLSIFLRSCALAGLALALAPTTMAASEAEVKAAMIYNIARFVQWPRQPGDGNQFSICALGDGEVAEALPALESKQLHGRDVVFTTVRRDADLTRCNVVYLAPNQALRLAAVSDVLARGNMAVLTIADAPNFIALGGMVQLVIQHGRPRFRIDQRVAERSGLDINAKLLQLALPPEV